MRRVTVNKMVTPLACSLAINSLASLSVPGWPFVRRWIVGPTVRIDPIETRVLDANLFAEQKKLLVRSVPFRFQPDSCVDAVCRPAAGVRGGVHVSSLKLLPIASPFELSI